MTANIEAAKKRLEYYFELREMDRQEGPLPAIRLLHVD